MTAIDAKRSFGEGLKSARRHQQTHAPHQQYPYSITSSARTVIVDGPSCLVVSGRPETGLILTDLNDW
jgi:hypothetical protein